MTERFTADYFNDRTFYQVQARRGWWWWCECAGECAGPTGGSVSACAGRAVAVAVSPPLGWEGLCRRERPARDSSVALQAGALVDNPDQRIAVDVK